MENENKRREELNEELVSESVEALETEVLEEPVAEEVDAAETFEEELTEDKSAFVEEDNEDASKEEETQEALEEVAEETAEVEVPGEEVVKLSEEEIAELKARKKKRIKFFGIIAAVVLAVVALAAFFTCYTEGTFGNTVVNKPISALQEDGEKTDNIKYENPILAIFGNDKNAVMKVDGVTVDKNAFQFFVNSTGINCAYSMLQMGMIQDVSDFDWNAVDKTSGLSYNELSKAMALDSLAPVYAVIAEGEKRGIVFTEEDEMQIRDWIDKQKTNYGDEFENVLKKSGYADETTLFEVQKIQVYSQKVYEDIMANLDSYVTDDIKKGLGDDKITVKHILIEVSSEEEKENAKKEAEMVLEKAKNGEEFEKLIDEYNDDPGMKNDPTGYTFKKDGTMVPEFEEASFELEVGEISGLVETDYGYHIIKRVERAVTAEDYIDSIGKKAAVRIKKGVYDNMTVNIDLNDYFGAPAEEETEESSGEAK